jgi:hypothetical protein
MPYIPLGYGIAASPEYQLLAMTNNIGHVNIINKNTVLGGVFHLEKLI